MSDIESRLNKIENDIQSTKEKFIKTVLDMIQKNICMQMDFDKKIKVIHEIFETQQDLNTSNEKLFDIIEQRFNALSNGMAPVTEIMNKFFNPK